MVNNVEERKEKEVETYNEDDVTDSVTNYITKFRDELPYNKKRYLMIILFIVLIMLVVYLGYAYGGLKVCSDLDGILDSDFKCHPDFNPVKRFDSVGMPFTLPNISVELNK